MRFEEILRVTTDTVEKKDQVVKQILNPFGIVTNQRLKKASENWLFVVVLN